MAESSSERTLAESSSEKTLGKTVLSDELSLESSVERTSLESSVERTFLDSSVGRTFGKTALSEKLLSSDESLQGHSLDSARERAHALHADTADTREEYSVMAITITSAQFPTLCGHPSVTHTDSESDGDSSDSVFYTRTSSSVNTTSSPLRPSSSLLASSSPLGPSSSLFGSSTMASTDMEPQVATEADADFGDDDNVKASDANKVKDQIEDDKKTSDANTKDDDGAKAIDASNKDQDDKKASDANSKDVVDDGGKAVDASSKDQVDNKGIDSGKDKDDDDWGNWKWTWEKKKEDQTLSHNAKKRLNKEMRELVRPVHVGCLAYVLPDKAKQCCLTWRQAVEHHLGTTRKRPTWSEHSFECKICHRFSKSEEEFEAHYAARHTDMSVYNQCLRRLANGTRRGCRKPRSNTM